MSSSSSLQLEGSNKIENGGLEAMVVVPRARFAVTRCPSMPSSSSLLLEGSENGLVVATGRRGTSTSSSELDEELDKA